MKTVRKALRDGELEKDTYERLVCADCEKQLKTRDNPDDVGSIRICEDCGAEWREI